MTHAFVKQPHRSLAGQQLAEVASAVAERPIMALFADDPRRFAACSLRVGPLLFDFSKTHYCPAIRDAGGALWQAAGWRAAADALIGGGIVNPTEGRPALHTATRGFRAPAVAANGDRIAEDVASADAKMAAVVQNVHAADYTAIIHIGIGGSVLGPAVIADALRLGTPGRYDLRFLSNIDGHAFEQAIAGLDPARTLLIACSKTWTTLEMQTNLAQALAWKQAAGVTNPYADVVAVTARPDLAQAQGVSPERIAHFGAWVGGRYSLWSAVGLPVALHYGLPVFEALRAGAREMDAHMADAPPEANAVLISALMGFLYAGVWGRATRAVMPYDQRLNLLVPFLQQLELESDGKRVDHDGDPYTGPAMPVVWGSVGTDAQHAVFQWLHQSSDWCPIDFIAVKTPSHGHATAHQALLANCLAQSSALLRGRADGVDAAQVSPGDRASTTILLDRLDAHALGALLAFYEHRTFAWSVLMGVNCFDQMGVELGKLMARDLTGPMTGAPLPAGWDASTAGLIAALR